ncbi:unnamed protein product [Echinostoma caproni]|uniref:Roc domain-containing protein n=1 Tax=Echinostoma caproni TaxID=27848 RepID=A0A3P8H0A1_9TREM|nr:unnamed protein product [Echinostoma caproni]
MRTLDLGNNPDLTRLAFEVCDLRNLQQLFLDGCSALYELPADLWRLPSLHALYLDCTPFDESVRSISYAKPASKIVQQPPTARASPAGGTTTQPAVNNETRRMLDEFRHVAEAYHPYPHLNLVVLGSPSSGKSTLIRLLHAVDQPENVFRATQHTKSKYDPPLEFKLKSSSLDDGSNATQIINSATGSSDSRIPDENHFQTGAVPAVHVSQLIIRSPSTKDGKTEATCSDLSSAPVTEDRVWFRVWDVEGVHTSMWDRQRQVYNPACFRLSTSALSCLQQITYSRASVFLVLWRMSDGVDGLNRVTRWLMDIRAHAESSPVILVGTHADQCPSGHSNPWPPIRLNRSSGRAMDRSKQSVQLLNALVRSRFAGQTDLAAFGLPSLFGHVVLNLMANRIKSSILLDPTPGTMPTCALINLAVPDLYHRAVGCVHEMTAEMLHSSLPPVLLVDQFLVELDRRLRRLGHPEPIEFNPNPLAGNNLSSYDRAPSTQTVHLASNQCVYLGRRSRGFESREEARSVLSFLREFGIVWHADDPQLHQVVFLSPVWLFQWLFGLFVEIGHRRSASTAVVRHGPLGTISQSNYSASSAILTQSEFLRMARAQLGEQKESDRIDLRSNRLQLALRVLIPVMSKLQLVIQLNTTRLLLPAFLSSRRVRLSCGSNFPPLSTSLSVPPNEVKRKDRSKCGVKPCLARAGKEQALVVTPGPKSLKRTAPWGPLDVRTVPGEEIVRLYVTTYVPTDFWTRLASRLLTDPSLDEICT